jgi:hypothetical protein
MVCFLLTSFEPKLVELRQGNLRNSMLDITLTSVLWLCVADFMKPTQDNSGYLSTDSIASIIKIFASEAARNRTYNYVRYPLESANDN